MIPWFQFTTIHLGPIPIQVWGSWVAFGMLVTMLILYKRAKRLGMDPNALLDQALWMIVCGLIAARVFHVVFYEPAFYIAHPIEILKVWHGGLSSFGGIVGAVVGFFLKSDIRISDFKNQLRKADTFSYAALFGWMIGRIGCFMIHDHLGVHSNCPLAIQTPDEPRLDMAFMEIFGLIPLAILFFMMRKKKLPEGWYTGILFIYYGTLRFILDFYRARDIIGADIRYFGLTPAQYFAILLVLLGGYGMVKIKNASTG